jgi:hypothetical protein
MASLPTHLVVTLVLDDRERTAIRDWMHNALGVLAVLAKIPCTRAERRMLNACLAAMQEAEGVLLEEQEAGT